VLPFPTVLRAVAPVDLVSGKEVPGARLDYHDEIVRDCSWHPTQNTIVTTSFDGSVVQCVTSEEVVNPEPYSAAPSSPPPSTAPSCSAPLQLNTLRCRHCVRSVFCERQVVVAATRECTAAGVGDGHLCCCVLCGVERQSLVKKNSMHTTATPASTCPAGGRRSRLSTRTQPRSAADAAGDTSSRRVQQRVQQKSTAIDSLQRLSMPVLWLCCFGSCRAVALDPTLSWYQLS
jgi:hypothetical protein